MCTSQMIGVGRESHGLYYLQPSSSVSWATAASSPKLPHERFGHPSLPKLNYIVPSLEKLKTLDCESCQLGKHVRSSFPRETENSSDSPFCCIHLDIWGPSPVSSFGFKYFVTFIDEFS